MPAITIVLSLLRLQFIPSIPFSLNRNHYRCSTYYNTKSFKDDQHFDCTYYTLQAVGIELPIGQLHCSISIFEKEMVCRTIAGDDLLKLKVSPHLKIRLSTEETSG